MADPSDSRHGDMEERKGEPRQADVEVEPKGDGNEMERLRDGRFASADGCEGWRQGILNLKIQRGKENANAPFLFGIDGGKRIRRNEN